MTSSRSGQFLAGMCIAGLGVCAGGWLVVSALISAGSTGGRWDRGAVTILATGAGLALVAAVTFACWAMAWRQILRADGLLYGEARRRSRREARREARQQARQARGEARLEAAAARREARQARREARAMGKRERVIQTQQAQAAPLNVDLATSRHDDLPGFAGTGFAGAAADVAVDAVGAEPEGVRPPNADRVLAQLRDLLGPLITALDAEPAQMPSVPVPARSSASHSSASQSPAPPDSDDLVAACVGKGISYDAEEAW
jgi:hypothetical protein